MASKKQLAILKKGVRVWNTWRKNNPREAVDLSKAKLTDADLFVAALSMADLSNSDLTGADLSGANLSGSNLVGAKLIDAKLIHANVSGANLSGAHLSSANLLCAYLSEANLSRAYLIEANFTRATLTHANFSKSNMLSTVFADCDLSTTKGLETVFHSGPSSIAIDTLYQSRGKIPDLFLRASGVPEDVIDHLLPLIRSGSPIQFYSCFISYSSKNQEFADRLYADLQTKGVRCWFAPEDLKIGDKFRLRIDESIRLHDKLLLVLSEPSVSSDWVEKEVETAMERERQEKRTVLFPIRLDDSVMEIPNGWPADIRRTRHIGDFTKWKNHDDYQNAFDRLLRDLQTKT